MVKRTATVKYDCNNCKQLMRRENIGDDTLPKMHVCNWDERRKWNSLTNCGRNAIQNKIMSEYVDCTTIDSFGKNENVFFSTAKKKIATRWYSPEPACAHPTYTLDAVCVPTRWQKYSFSGWKTIGEKCNDNVAHLTKLTAHTKWTKK